MPEVLLDGRLYVPRFYLTEPTLTSQSRDINEGADIVMVKPSLPYLDIISDCTTVAPNHPVACYQVSGEYAMVCAGAEKGIYDLKEMAFETTESFVRAGESMYRTMMLPWSDPQVPV